MEDIAFIPTTKLSKTKHASWLASVGNKQMLNIYNACISHLANALLQMAKMLAFVEGKYKGTGPSAKNLARCVASGKHMPAKVIFEIEETVQGTPMYRHPYIEGDNITVSKKQKTIGIVSEEEENASHRPVYVTQNQPRRNTQTMGKGGHLPTQEIHEDEDLFIDKTQVHKTMWAICKIPRGSKVQCQGYLGNRYGKCKKSIKNSGIGTVAPSFFGNLNIGKLHQ